MTRETVAFDVARLVADAVRIVAGRARERCNEVRISLGAVAQMPW
jgi:hypothetical protein